MNSGCNGQYHYIPGRVIAVDINTFMQHVIAAACFQRNLDFPPAAGRDYTLGKESAGAASTGPDFLYYQGCLSRVGKFKDMDQFAFGLNHAEIMARLIKMNFWCSCTGYENQCC